MSGPCQTCGGARSVWCMRPANHVGPCDIPRAIAGQLHNCRACGDYIAAVGCSPTPATTAAVERDAPPSATAPAAEELS